MNIPILFKFALIKGFEPSQVITCCLCNTFDCWSLVGTEYVLIIFCDFLSHFWLAFKQASFLRQLGRQLKLVCSSLTTKACSKMWNALNVIFLKTEYIACVPPSHILFSITHIVFSKLPRFGQRAGQMQQTAVDNWPHCIDTYSALYFYLCISVE